MKKIFTFFMTVCVCMAGAAAVAADFQVKKASNVKQQEKSGMENITSDSLLPGVIGLVSNVAALNKQQKELTAECAPTETEITWVNNMVKEYAKIAAVSGDDMRSKIGGVACGIDGAYQTSVQTNRPANTDVCVPVFSGDGADNGAIWVGYPRAAYAKYCPGDVTFSCPESQKKTETNIYKVFGAIDFAPEDYTANESGTYVKFMEKMEKCAPEKISARNRQAYTEFLKTTITGVGQNTNTATVWDTVSNLAGSSGMQGVTGLSGAVTQFLQQ